MREAERQRRAVEAVRKAGGWVSYDYEIGDIFPSRGEPSAPAWLRRLIGEDVCSDVIGVGLQYPAKVDDGILEHLRGLAEVKTLVLCGTQVRDVEAFKGLTRLETLNLIGTQVTQEGVEELRKALPDCHILWKKSSTPPPKTNLDQP